MNLRSGIHVVANDSIGPAAPFNVYHGTQRHHLSCGSSRFETSNVLGLGAKLSVGLGADLKRTAEQIEVVHINRAKIHLQRFKDVCERHVEHVGLHAVDVGVELRC